MNIEETNASAQSWSAPNVPPEPPREGFSRRSLFRGGTVAALVASAAVGGIAGSAITAARLAGGPSVAHAGPTVSARLPAQSDTDITALYQAVSGSVVAVQTATAARQRTAPGAVPGSDSVPTGEGTGFIVAGDGTIFTNFHVVSGADRLTVVLFDGTRLEAKVIGTDPGSDLAVLRANIPTDRTGIATLGDSDAVQPGQMAIAIGTPFGLDHTVTAGIISAVGREFGTTPGGRPARGLIQTDAPINPGNSGGPLFNAAGEVIGITTSIESPVRGSVGIGFAVPINRARMVLTQVRAGKPVEHAWLGVSIGTLTPELAATLGLPEEVRSGLALSQVVPSGPAAKAGLRGSAAPDGTPRGDVIVAIDGRPVMRVAELSAYLEQKNPGDVVTVTIWRGGDRKDVAVTLQAWPTSSS